MQTKRHKYSCPVEEKALSKKEKRRKNKSLTSSQSLSEDVKVALDGLKDVPKGSIVLIALTELWKMMTILGRRVVSARHRVVMT